MKSAILHPIGGLGGHLQHDPEGKLLGMGHNATAKVIAAQSLSKSSALRNKLFKDAMCIRVKEKEGWLAVRTDKFPAGDLEGAAKASLAIACYYLELDELEKGRKWLEHALEEAPKDNKSLCAIIEHNMDCLEKVMRECSASSTPCNTPVQSGRSSPVLDPSSLAHDLANITL